MPLWALAFCNAEAREYCDICMSINHDTRACEDYDSPDEDRTPKSKSSRQWVQWEVERQGGSAGKIMHQVESVQLHTGSV